MNRKLLLLVVAATIFVPLSLIACRKTAQDRDCVPRAALTNLKLILAAEEGKVEWMDALIKAGADVNTSDDLFGTPLVAAASSDNYQSVRLLVDNGANVNPIDYKEYTPLMMAALRGNVDVVRLLLSKGADVNASTYPLIHGKRTSKFTALIIAEGRKNEAIVKLLKDAGAKE